MEVPPEITPGPPANLATGSQNMQVAPIFWRGTRPGQAGEAAHNGLLDWGLNSKLPHT
jgi:hypothetical protein